MHEKRRVSNPECLGCTECVGACPEKGCLELGLGYTAKARALPFWGAAAGTLVLLAVFYCGAVSTDNWNSKVPPAMAREFHRDILRMEHP